MSDSGGSYVLVLALDEPASIAVGRLGEFSFPAGYYLYVGSALRGVSGRVKHYLGEIARTHWHIDYLRPRCRLVDIWYGYSAERRECIWAGALGRLRGIQASAPGFGSSDCRCRSHLFYSADTPCLEDFREALSGDEVRRLNDE